MRISDWSSDVCSSDLRRFPLVHALGAALIDGALAVAHDDMVVRDAHRLDQLGAGDRRRAGAVDDAADILEVAPGQVSRIDPRSEEHTSELQSLMRLSYVVFCLQQKI